MEQGTREDTDEERAVHLFGDQRQTDSDYGREERPEAACDIIARGQACYYQKPDYHDGGNR